MSQFKAKDLYQQLGQAQDQKQHGHARLIQAETLLKSVHTPLPTRLVDARKEAEYRTRRIRAIPSHKSRH
ncbi:MAG TPA: hypothetical protein VGT44_15965, partial [Ktedonobacteraceae bacterium]|nr:hypothetical protein [Ktedonobacteraceae bacterium]